MATSMRLRAAVAPGAVTLEAGAAGLGEAGPARLAACLPSEPRLRTGRSESSTGGALDAVVDAGAGEPVGAAAGGASGRFNVGRSGSLSSPPVLSGVELGGCGEVWGSGGPLFGESFGDPDRPPCPPARRKR